jgi:hypothetical protein
MSEKAQWALFENVLGENANTLIVATAADCAWNISTKDFETVTVTPSIDASKSGNWHGFIVNGEIK